MKHQTNLNALQASKREQSPPLGHRTQSGAQTTKDSDPRHIQSNASNCANRVTTLDSVKFQETRETRGSATKQSNRICTIIAQSEQP
ncbi:hypothetical protein Nepgr_031268 [Nepenthes gracilis]|uniref:Uncharacterized protein n=1 Tax=Nepenthes gracilis TaxID=150966 RepID=A0AAD3TH26_NEPGR|nr:hypothetical protein Nepgr_031268 [Nepenthes gracilis]